MIEVVAGAILKNGRFLAAQRRSGVWEFPGGKVEPGESRQDALAREMSEELAVQATVQHFVASNASPRLNVSLFTAKTNDEPQPLDHYSLAWLDPHTARQLYWQPHDLPLLYALLNFLENSPESTAR